MLKAMKTALPQFRSPLFACVGILLLSSVGAEEGSWSALGGGLDGSLEALATDGGALYALGGDFGWSGGGPTYQLARWDGSSWSSIGPSSNNHVYALAAIHGSVYMGGGFSQVGEVPASNIARWDGTGWSALGAGLDQSVHALLAVGGDLYAGGGFEKAGDQVVNRIAKWDGAEWSALGGGADGDVLCLGWRNGLLYAGGNFSEIGGVAADRIAVWNGSAWAALGAGVNSKVKALAFYGGDLVAGGEFTEAGGLPAWAVARWDGSAWHPLAGGLNNDVHALAVFDGRLYAGGSFSQADGKEAKALARWDGASWSEHDGGLRSNSGGAVVKGLAVSGRRLFVGGAFNRAGETAVGNVASWSRYLPPQLRVARPKRFPTLAVGRRSRPQLIRIDNLGETAAIGLAVRLSGPARAEFGATRPAASELAPGARTSFRVVFRPRRPGVRRANATLRSANAAPRSVPLVGRGRRTR
jgi:hypothetical protein